MYFEVKEKDNEGKRGKNGKEFGEKNYFYP
jgi:hypothetical protein